MDVHGTFYIQGFGKLTGKISISDANLFEIILRCMELAEIARMGLESELEKQEEAENRDLEYAYSSKDFPEDEDVTVAKQWYRRYGFPSRVVNALGRNDITRRRLIDMSTDELTSLRGLGVISARKLLDFQLQMRRKGPDSLSLRFE